MWPGSRSCAVAVAWAAAWPARRPRHGQPSRTRTGDLPPKKDSGDLVPKEEDLRVLSGWLARQQRKPAEHPDHEEADEQDEHDRRQSRSSTCARALPAVGPRHALRSVPRRLQQNRLGAQHAPAHRARGCRRRWNSADVDRLTRRCSTALSRTSRYSGRSRPGVGGETSLERIRVWPRPSRVYRGEPRLKRGIARYPLMSEIDESGHPRVE